MIFKKCFYWIFCASDLTRHLVSDYAAIEHLMEQGNTHRYGIRQKKRLARRAFCQV